MGQLWLERAKWEREPKVRARYIDPPSLSRYDNSCVSSISRLTHEQLAPCHVVLCEPPLRCLWSYSCQKLPMITCNGSRFSPAPLLVTSKTHKKKPDSVMIPAIELETQLMKTLPLGPLTCKRCTSLDRRDTVRPLCSIREINRSILVRSVKN